MLSASTVWLFLLLPSATLQWTPIVWPDKVDSRTMALLESSWPLSLYISELLRHHPNLGTDSYQAAVAFSLSRVQSRLNYPTCIMQANPLCNTYLFYCTISLETIPLEAFICIQMLPKINYEYVHVMSYLLRTVKLIFI